MATLVQADAWVLGSYRRMDALDVPAFHDYALAAARTAVRTRTPRLLSRLGTRWPQGRQRFGAFVHGEAAPPLPPDEALGLVLRYLASPLRYEPLNSTGVHRAVASTRSLFPVQFLLLVNPPRGAAGPRLFTYHPEHHAFEPRQPAGPLPGLPEGCEWAIVGVGRYWILAGKYGEYAPYVVTLEAGMLQAQLDHLVRLAGRRGHAIDMEGSAWRAALALGPLEAVLVGLAGEGPAPDIGSDAQAVDVAEWKADPALAALYPRLLPLARLFDPGSNPPGQAPASGAPWAVAAAPPACAGTAGLGVPGERDVLDLFQERSSGNDTRGFSPVMQATDAVFFRRLMALWQELGQRRDRLPGEEALTVSIAWLCPKGEPVGLYSVALERLYGQDDEMAFLRSLEASLPHPLFRYNTAAFSYIFVIAADLPAASLMHGAHALRRLHLGAGAIAQDISIALTAFGMFARPVRMLEETTLANTWKMKSHIVYQVLAGFNRSTNWGMGLL